VLEDAQLEAKYPQNPVLDGGDVVVADVQEHGGGELHAHHPVILQGLGGDLHGQVVQPRRGGVGQMALQVQGLGGGEVRLEAFYPVVGVNGADDPALGPRFARLILVKNILQVIRGGTFPFCTGDAHHMELAGGVVVVEIGQQAMAAAHR
jgi:hypothetical protein